MKQWNIRVEGKVQGVSYRASTKAVADQLGVKGFVVNEPDGSVYIEAVGDAFALESFRDWCWDGPDAAEVKNVSIQETTPLHSLNFEVIKKRK